MPAGYSSTPLAKKLGIKPGFDCLLCNEPDHYFDLFSDLPVDLKPMKRIQKGRADFVHLFCTRFKELQKLAPKYKNAIKKTGMIWISWPKGGSKIETDLKREPIREFMLELGLVDVKVAAIDEDWSGLKFVYRTKDR